MTPLADSYLFCRGPSSLEAILDSLQSDAPTSVPFSDIFIFPFSLRVDHLLGFIHGDCMVECSSLANMSMCWSSRLSSSFGSFNRNEIRLSSRALISSTSGGISASLTSSSQIGMESKGVGNEDKYHEVDSSNTTSLLTQAYLVQGL